jgi:periplasmic nitrate reductase NapE
MSKPSPASPPAARRNQELAVFLLLSLLLAPVLAVGTVGGYGLGIWIYQMFTGPPGPPPKTPRPPGIMPDLVVHEVGMPPSRRAFSPANGRLPIRGGKPPAVAWSRSSALSSAPDHNTLMLSPRQFWPLVTAKFMREMRKAN